MAGPALKLNTLGIVSHSFSVMFIYRLPILIQPRQNREAPLEISFAGLERAGEAKSRIGPSYRPFFMENGISPASQTAEGVPPFFAIMGI
jgi:hypothetical protein